MADYAGYSLSALTFHFLCFHCGVEHTQRIELLGEFHPLPYPELPAGWQRVNGRWYCPAHEIIIKTSGVEEGKVHAAETA